MGGKAIRSDEVVVPSAWTELARGPLRGLVMIVGASDTGKSTLAHWLFEHLAARSSAALAFLDGDPGQSTLGPPTTVTLLVSRPGTTHFPGSGHRWRRFVGSISPKNCEIQLLTAVARLAEVARGKEIRTIIYDTTGLVDPLHGGVDLKRAKIDLLRPQTLIAIRRRNELDPLLALLRRSSHARIVELDAAQESRRHSTLARQHYRARRFAEHFAGAAGIQTDLSKFAVFPDILPCFNRLLALEDESGFTLALGIATHADQASGTATIFTPLPDLTRVRAIRLASLAVDPVTFCDQHLEPAPRLREYHSSSIR